MNARRYVGLFFSKTYTRNKLLTRETLSVFFSMLGVIWLVMRLTSYLNPAVDEFTRHYATIWSVSLLGMILTLINRRPDVKITEKVRGFDIIINIKVGDVMEGTESCVISTNTTFDTNVGTVIAADSVQGQLTRKFYNNSVYLDTDIKQALIGDDYEDIHEDQHRPGKTKKYPLGTVVKVAPKGRTFYLLAMADINSYGNAVCNFTMISDALNSLWQFLGEAGDYEKELLIPVIGTGAGRVTESREEIIREIVNSFIAASTQKRLCDILSIVIHSSDFYKFNIKMEDLKHYLSAQCRYSSTRRLPGRGTGESR